MSKGRQVREMRHREKKVFVTKIFFLAAIKGSLYESRVKSSLIYTVTKEPASVLTPRQESVEHGSYPGM